MQQTLRRPTNWQDFEELCKHLWGEIWNCPEIVRHGRQGQNQQGVDIYGIPKNEESYYGIQCKGKSEYTNAQFTEKEIDEEIEKAKLFEPPLAKYYLATTAVKDAKIESYVRKKNIELRKVGLFGIVLYSWEDIVDLIDENRNTHDWYVRGQQYKTLKSVKVSLDGDAEITVHPKFDILHITYKQKAPNPYYFNNGFQVLDLSFPPSYPQMNLSYFKINLKILNDGLNSMEDYKLNFKFTGKIEDISDTNIEQKTVRSTMEGIAAKVNHGTTKIDKITKMGVFTPRWPSLVSKDYVLSDDIFIKTKPEETVIGIEWELLAKEYNQNGVLKINAIPQIEEEYRTVLTDDYMKYGRTENKGIQDKMVNLTE